MKVKDLAFRDVFEKFLILRCTWNDVRPKDSDVSEFPWPDEADALLVYAYDNIGDNLSLSILCPVVFDENRFLTEKTPEKVNAKGWGLGGSINERVLDVEAVLPNQEEMAELGLLPETVFWGNASIDPLRTFSNYDTFEVEIDCDSYGMVPARVRLTDYQEDTFKGKLLDMLDDGIEIYENDELAVRVDGAYDNGLPRLVVTKIPYEPPVSCSDVTPEMRAAVELWTNGLGSSAKRFESEDPMPPKREKATKDSWRSRRDMPSRYEDFYLGLEITSAEKEILEYGHIPMEMEDHWYMYYEDDVIHYHRSWTGYCMFEAKVEPCEDHYIVSECRVNRYPGHNRGTDVEYDKYWLAQLILWEIGRQ